MGAYNELQNELIKQKEEIEQHYGTVKVAKNNPSPAEITAGIKTIPQIDLTVATATEADVKQGKTFFAGDDATIRTGTANIGTEETNAIFAFPEAEIVYEGDVYFSVPDYLKKIRKYSFYKNYHNVHVVFHENVETIEDYAFYYTKNFSFTNFEDMTKLKYIGIYGFARSSLDGIDNYSQLQSSVQTMSSYAFYYSSKPYSDFKFPDGLTSLGQYVYMAETRQLQNNLDLSNYKLKYLYPYTFANQAFNCDLIIPENVTSLNTMFAYDGCFKNATIPANVTNLGNSCLGATKTNSVSDFYLNTVVFESATPPTIGTTCFALQNLENGLKIYVPDEAIEEYKAVVNLEPYLDVILPVSQKP